MIDDKLIVIRAIKFDVMYFLLIFYKTSCKATKPDNCYRYKKHIKFNIRTTFQMTVYHITIKWQLNEYSLSIMGYLSD